VGQFSVLSFQFVLVRWLLHTVSVSDTLLLLIPPEPMSQRFDPQSAILQNHTPQNCKPPSSPIPVWSLEQYHHHNLPQIQPPSPLEMIVEQIQSLPKASLEMALQNACDTLRATGIRLYLTGYEDQPPQWYTAGSQPSVLSSPTEHLASRQVEEHLVWQQFLQSSLQAESPAQPWLVSDLQLDFQLRTLAVSFQEIAASQLMVVPLYQHSSIEIADRPDSSCSLLGSFSIFRSELPWQDAEITLFQQVGHELAQAIAQQRLSTKMTRISQKMQQQTQSLQKSLCYQQSLASIVMKIRASIDLQQIFHSTVDGLYELLKVDRAIVYRFNPDWSGGIVAEAVGTDWPTFDQIQQERAIVRNYIQTGDTCVVASFPDQPIADQDEHLRLTQGGDFAQNRSIKQVVDIYQQGFSDCYVEFLAGFDCRAYLTAPIFLGDRLWGLLATYQNQVPRHWQTLEVQLIGQAAEQLGVAIQQAELLERTRSQQQSLAQALSDLKSTQSQLVHAEKMSSLGQLVAGIAHEVNNPVNFVHGNLVHLTNYFQEIFGVLELCQQYRSRLPNNIQGFLESIDIDFICEDVPKLINSMQIGTQRISEIVLSLRNFSRLDEADIKLVDLHDGIDGTCLILQNQCYPNGDFQGIDLIRQYGDLPLVECYAGQLNQVFMNVLSNAIDALKTRDAQRTVADCQANPSQIHIITEMAEMRDRPSALVRIRDNGPGIAEAVAAQIFNPFFTTKPIGQGTGLGLSISHQIITEQHRGELRCHSQVGIGTEFQIEIPLTNV
jgi:signal transduction histidine kinase